MVFDFKLDCNNSLVNSRMVSVINIDGINKIRNENPEDKASGKIGINAVDKNIIELLLFKTFLNELNLSKRSEI